MGHLPGNDVAEPFEVSSQPRHPAQLVTARFEVRHALQRIVGPTGFAIFLVADDVQPDGRLLLHDLRGRARDDFRRLFLGAFPARGGERLDFRGARRAAYMRGENSFFAS
jgi:hypothetical protein